VCWFEEREKKERRKREEREEREKKEKKKEKKNEKMRVRDHSSFRSDPQTTTKTDRAEG